MSNANEALKVKAGCLVQYRWRGLSHYLKEIPGLVETIKAKSFKRRPSQKSATLLDGVSLHSKL